MYVLSIFRILSEIKKEIIITILEFKGSCSYISVFSKYMPVKLIHWSLFTQWLTWRKPVNWFVIQIIMAGGVSVTLKIIGKYHQRSHLVQGGLEGPCKMTVIMSRSVVNHLLLTRYEKGAERILYRTKERRNCLNFPFSREWKREASGGKKATEKKEEARSGDIRDMLPNPRSKKDNQENHCT